MADPATVVLVHGGASGGWTWHLVVDELLARGIDTRAPDLPSCSAPDNTIGPADDVAHLRSVMDEIGRPLVLVGNSYGGFVITGAANGRSDVHHLVYIAGIMPDPGRPLMDTIMESTAPSEELGLEFLDDGRIVFEVEADLRTSYQLAPQTEHEFVRARAGKPMSLGNAPAVLDDVAWTSIPSTYVVCTEDHALRVDVQRAWARRATNAIEVAGEHCPQHSRPMDIADILERIARDED